MRMGRHANEWRKNARREARLTGQARALRNGQPNEQVRVGLRR